VKTVSGQRQLATNAGLTTDRSRGIGDHKATYRDNHGAATKLGARRLGRQFEDEDVSWTDKPRYQTMD
jgi:hypothetical protein